MSNNLPERSSDREKALEKFAAGNVYVCSLTISPEIMEQFRVLSADSNPVHLDGAYAKTRGFDGAIAFGGLMAALLSRLVGMELPTRDVVIVQSKFDFRSPAYVGQTVELRAEVASVHVAVETVSLKLHFGTADKTVCTGQCLIKCV